MGTWGRKRYVIEIPAELEHASHLELIKAGTKWQGRLTLYDHSLAGMMHDQRTYLTVENAVNPQQAINGLKEKYDILKNPKKDEP